MPESVQIRSCCASQGGQTSSGVPWTCCVSDMPLLCTCNGAQSVQGCHNTPESQIAAPVKGAQSSLSCMQSIGTIEQLVWRAAALRQA